MDLRRPTVPENRSNQCHLATDPSTCASVAMEIPPCWGGETMLQPSKWGSHELLSSLRVTGSEVDMFPLCRTKVCTRNREQLAGDSELTIFIKSSCLRNLMGISIESIMWGFLSGVTSSRLRRRAKTPRPRKWLCQPLSSKVGKIERSNPLRTILKQGGAEASMQVSHSYAPPQYGGAVSCRHLKDFCPLWVN